MRYTLFAVALTCAVTSAMAQQSPPTPILPGSVKWETFPGIKGLESAWLVGGPDKKGIYAQRVKLPNGARIPPHTHPDERFSVVLSGTIYVGFGEVFDEKRMAAIPTGAIYVAPAGVPHYLWAKDGDAVYQESGSGPTATDFVKR